MFISFVSFLSFLFFTLCPSPSSPLLSLLSLLPFSGRRHKMIKKGWRVVTDNLPAAQTWRRKFPPVHVIIKYQRKSHMKCVSHKLNWKLKCQGISSGYKYKKNLRSNLRSRPRWLNWMRRPRSATFFRGDWSWNIFYCHSLPSADSRRTVVSFWRRNVHSTG